MPKGNDLHHARMTLGEAHAWCMAHDECRGFTYHASEPAPLDSVYVWFKSTDKVVAGAGWYSYVKGARRAARMHGRAFLPPPLPRARALPPAPAHRRERACGGRAARAAGGAGAGTGDGAPALVRAGSDKPSGAPKLGSLSLSSMFSSSHGRSQQGAQQPPPPASAALALLTRKPLHFEWWLRYHMQLGICHFFIHVEDTPELLPLLASEPYRGVVTISQKGDASHFKDNYWTLQDRQRAHVNTSLARAREMGIEWLFHVDDDELIWLDKPFAEVVAAAPKGTTNITFSNLEAIPTTVEPVNYFEHIHSFTKKRMLAYVNGKPVGRTVPETKLDGPHRFCACRRAARRGAARRGAARARAHAATRCSLPAAHGLPSSARARARRRAVVRGAGDRRRDPALRELRLQPVVRQIPQPGRLHARAEAVDPIPVLSRLDQFVPGVQRPSEAHAAVA